MNSEMAYLREDEKKPNRRLGTTHSSPDLTISLVPTHRKARAGQDCSFSREESLNTRNMR